MTSDTTSATHTLITAFVSGKLSYDALSKQLRTGAQQSANALDETRQAIRGFVEAGHLPNELGQRLLNQLPAGDAKPFGYNVKDNPPRPHAVHGTQQEPVSAPAPEQAAMPPANMPPLPLLNEPAGATGGETASDETRGKMDEAILTSLVAGYAGFRSRRANAGEEPPSPADSGKLDKYLTEFKSARFRSDARRVSGGGQRDSLDVNKLATPQVKRAGVGSILRDRFILDTEIGSGGMGHVYSAVDRRRLEAAHDQPYVAIKLLNENYRNDTEAVRLLEAEARKSQALAHPNITTVYDFDRDKADVFIVMEQLNGVGLDRRIGRALGKPLPLGECARVLRGTCAGLSHAHSRGVVHSDLKPGNIFLLTDGTIKLLDFGLAAAASASTDHPIRDSLTSAYASPEQFRRADRDPRDDVFALGCIAYQILTGGHPFQFRPIDEVAREGIVPAPVEGLSPQAWNTLRQALAFDRNERLGDVDSFLKGLFEMQD